MISVAPVARPAELSREVVRTLEHGIRARKFAPGQRLPTEKELGTRFGVSRAVVREAIARLKSDGYVETRQGAGAFVAARPGLLSFKLAAEEPIAHADLRHIQELRAAVEGAAAELAAVRRTAADLAAIRRELDAMAEAIRRGTDGSDADGRFHRCIGMATHNPHLYRFVEFLDHQFSETRRPGWDPARHRAGKPRAAQREHQRLYAAIAAGNPRAARAAAVRHLMNSMVRMGWTPRHHGRHHGVARGDEARAGV
jgi:GntR family transcriptional repressor for pyruvate dehydrogenase complex